nr:immunoglobulin light chain junction region [Mus musculus]
CQQYWSTPPTF